MEELNTRRIVILGKTGVGKSSLANTIFGEKVFKTDAGLNSGTRKCQAQTRSVNGRNLTLIDTPGFFDTERKEEDMKAEILRCITECAPGPHAFLIVLKAERYTEHEQSVIEKIQQYFSEEALKYATVLFTHGDQLPDGMKIEEFVDQNDAMKDLVKKCGNRCHVIDNKYWNENLKDKYRNNQFQVEELLKTIDKIMLANNGSCYTNEMLQAVQENIKQEEKEIRKSSGNMSGEEIRKKAKDSVFNRFWIKLAGVTAGALMGALLGVAGMAVLKFLQTSAGLKGFKKSIREAAVKGAVAGGIRGYVAAEEADTPLEAAKMAAGAVKDDATSLFDNTAGLLNRPTHPHSGSDGKPN